MGGGGEIVFLDFEASSLGKKSYPIEVAWVFASGHEETHLIRPAAEWTDWAADAEATHHISRATLIADGEPHDAVARHMVAALAPHSLYATAPSWDGQWLSKLLRAAGLPRHSLRLQDTDVAHREAIGRVLRAARIPDAQAAVLSDRILEEVRQEDRGSAAPAHRALDDTRREMELLHKVEERARAFASGR